MLFLKIMQLQSKPLISTQCGVFSLGFLHLLHFYCDFILTLFDIITWYSVQVTFTAAPLALTGVELTSKIPVLLTSILQVLRTYVLTK